MPETSQTATPRESETSGSMQAALATAILVSLPTLTVLLTFLGTSLLVGPRRDDVQRRHHSYVARSLQTLPGQNGTWWVDDPHTYFLTPPVREYLAKRLPSLEKQNILPSRAFDQSSQASFSYHEHFAKGKDLQSFVGDKMLPEGPFDNVNALELEWYDLSQSQKNTAADLHLRAVVAHKVGNLWQRDQVTPLQADDAKPADEGGPPPTSGPSADLTGPTTAPQIATANITPTSKQQWYAAAQQEYDAALQLYYRNPYHNRALLALCLSDRTRLYLDQGQRSRAAREFERAQEVMAKGRDGSAELLDFSIDCLCQSALAYRAEGNYGLARRQLETALERLQLKLPTKAFDGNVIDVSGDRAARKAYVLERLGWINIDVWRIGEARECFDAAGRFRSHLGHFPSSANSIETQLAILQNGHGIAMTNRYAGNNRTAATGYAEILHKIYQLLALTDHGEFHVEPRRLQSIFVKHGCTSKLDDRNTFRATHDSDHLLVNQLLNTLERYADCYLFGWHTSPVSESAGPLETVLEIRQSQPMPERSTGESQARVLCKLSLDLARRDEFDRATAMLVEADRLYPPQYHSEKFVFLRNVSRAACISGADGGYGDRLAAVLEDGFAALSRRGKFTRDELDIAIFAATLLFRAKAPPQHGHAALFFKLAIYPIEYAMAAVETSEQDDRLRELTPYFRGPYAGSIRHCLLAFPPNVNMALELINDLTRMEASFGNQAELVEFFATMPQSDS